MRPEVIDTMMEVLKQANCCICKDRRLGGGFTLVARLAVQRVAWSCTRGDLLVLGLRNTLINSPLNLYISLRLSFSLSLFEAPTLVGPFTKETCIFEESTFVGLV